MKRLFVIPVICLLLSSFVSRDNGLRYLSNNSFTTGEQLEYKVKFGAFGIGEGTVEISDNLYKVNDRPCYRVKVYGRTTGTADALKFSKVRDTWISYIDKHAIVSQKFFAEIHEGKYFRRETTYFDHENNKAKLKLEKKKTTKNLEFDVPSNIQDMISGYYYLRTLDYSKYEVGDIIQSDAFVIDELYDFKVRYQGKTTLKMKEGKIDVIKLMPIMPENSYFDGEDAVTFYISDDENKVPLYIKANMFIANIKIFLQDHKGLKHDLKFE